MRALDKSKRYNLEYLTGDEKEQVFNYLKEFSEWKDFNVDYFKKQLYKGISFEKEYNLWMMTNDYLNTNAKELFYTLENIQVDCRELSEEQINEMCEVFIKNGHDYYDTKNYALKIYDECVFMQHDEDGFLIDSESVDKTTITYSKFMYLFGRKEENFKKLVEVVNEELTEESFKEITNSIADLLIYKNEKYGNSALNPLDIFNGKSKVGQRIDDKLARVKNSKELRKNDIADLLGYLTLVCQENGWTNFDEFKD